MESYTLALLKSELASTKKRLEDAERLKQDAINRHKTEYASRIILEKKLDSLKGELESAKTEKEARIILEKRLDYLKEELERARQNALTSNEKVKTLEDKNKMLQENNMKLENQLERATIGNKNLEREKDMISKYNVTLEKLCLIYETQIANDKDSGDDAVEQKETSEKN